MKYLIAGLGNIGPEYELTRHNIGFLTLDRLADLEKFEFRHDRHAYVAEWKFKGKTLILIKPTTYMNLSGKALNYWMKEEKIAQENILVITDDIALPFGKLRMRKKGSNAGHNGLGNIDQVLGTQEYARLRFGVGNDFPKGRQADYVLGRFSDGDFAELPLKMDKAIEMIKGFCTMGIDKTMSQYND